MHIILKNEETGKTEGVVCVDRQTQNCTVLEYTESTLENLVQIAKAMKANHVYMFSPSKEVMEHTAAGWQIVQDPVLMKKGD